MPDTSKLHKMATAGYIATVEFLLKHDPNNDIETNATDGAGRNVLHCAASESSVKMIQLLLKYDAEINANDYYGDTAPHLAVGAKNRPPGRPLYSVRLLLKQGAYSHILTNTENI
jgi:ankyrin repeat protein